MSREHKRRDNMGRTITRNITRGSTGGSRTPNRRIPRTSNVSGVWTPRPSRIRTNNSNQCFSYGYYCEDEAGNGWCEENDQSSQMSGQEAAMAEGYVICERVESTN